MGAVSSRPKASWNAVELENGPRTRRWRGLCESVAASVRATKRPAATWRDFWREYLWLATGVWVGVVAALVAADLVLGRALL